MNRFVTKSTVDKKNLVIMSVLIAIFAVMLIMTLVKWLVWHNFQPMELLFYAVILIALIKRITAKYHYEMELKALRIVKTEFARQQQYEIAYPSILGIYQYQPQLIGGIKFRRTERLHSALDGRDVWTLAYRVANKEGKTEHRRIYFKPGRELLLALKEKLPDTVMVTEEVAIRNSLDD